MCPSPSAQISGLIRGYGLLLIVRWPIDINPDVKINFKPPQFYLV
jgi:hypothetical protein